MHYTIPCVWQNYGHMNIEADSLEEAIEKANGPDEELPRGEYVEGSFEVDRDVLLDWNPEHEAEVKEYISTGEQND